MTEPLLPAWRPGATRDAIVAFLDAALDLPVEQRVACLDNDGTLWCERPTYVQYDFLADALRRAAADDPSVTERPELAAVLAGDAAMITELGLERVALALVGLFAGVTPDDFTAAVRRFFHHARNPVLDRPLAACRYEPMLELIDALHRRAFTVSIVTGGGTEFVRALSAELYGVAPERVVGTRIGYDLTRDDDGRIVLRRGSHPEGPANEGAAKVAMIQAHLGRRPILAAGNSGGDREMLEWALSGTTPGLALLIDHDDDQREFRYTSTAATFAEPEPVTGVGRRLGWTVVSMAADWEEVFVASGAG
jgi:phosphoserine phosphatase